MMKLKPRIKGMTIPEILMSILIGALLLGIVLSMWYFSYKNWTVENIRTRLRVNLEIGMERIKEEARLSSTTYMSLADPAAGTNYEAISFPMATPDGNGFFAKAGGYIAWDKSVIYHAYDPGTGLELRRTEFTNNNSVLINDSQRNLQLVNTVANGDGTGGPNSANAKTDILFDSLVGFAIAPRAQGFDGYSPTAQRSDNVKFGSVRLNSGNHDLKFEVTGKNANSSGYELGIDTISITPSGGYREAEIYTPVAESGGSDFRVGPDIMWSGNYHLEYTSGGVGDYVTLKLYYDKWIESNFNNAVLDNTFITGNDLYLALPAFDEGNESGWQAEVEAGSIAGDATKDDYDDAGGAPKLLDDITVRTLISSGVTSGNLVSNGDSFRVKFDSHSAQPLTITSAYIDERDMSSMNQDAASPALLGPAGSETRIQLYFTDGAGNITPNVTIASGSSAYSNWAIFPIDITKDYFVTFHITSTVAEAYVSYWEGTIASQPPNDVNSYLLKGDRASEASWATYTYMGHDTPDIATLNADEYISSKSIYALAEMETWKKTGSVTSAIYDTKIADPGYNSIGWDESEPAGSNNEIFARSSDNENMSGAAWDSGSSANPHSLSIGTGRYAQFRADMSLTPFWTCIDHSAVNISDAQYKNTVLPVITCPIGGKYLIPGTNATWIDNVGIDWPGETKICEISGYFAQKPDYGIIKLTVDGNELTKGLEFNITVSEPLGDDTYYASLTAEVEPRNTGR